MAMIEDMKAYKHAYYLKNRKKILAKQKQYNNAHKDVRHKHYIDNRERLLSYQKQYYQEHKDVIETEAGLDIEKKN